MKRLAACLRKEAAVPAAKRLELLELTDERLRVGERARFYDRGESSSQQ